MDEKTKLLERHIGHKIRERRKALSLTQPELGAMIGISFQQVQRYESGENAISLSRMLEIANVLNVKPTYFYENAPQPTLLGTAVPSETIQRTNNRPLRILLIEDTSSDALLFRKAVEREKNAAHIDCVDDAQAVMNYLRHHREKYGTETPDLILLDINMPGINGLELLRQIKSDSRLRITPVIMLTNSIRNKDMHEAYRLGANGFIQKSSDLQEFYDDISRMLNFWGKTAILPLAG